MEAIGAVANIIALVDLSAKVAKVCFQYSKEVSSARTDIERLRRQAEHLEITLKAAQRLVEENRTSSLPTSQALISTFKSCKNELERTLKKLQPSPMRRYGIRSLKWPFKSKEIDQLLDFLKNYEGSILAGLQVDQTALLLDIQEGVKQLNLQATGDASAYEKPHMMMPFTPDPDFICRPSIEEWMKEQFARPTQRMALVGMGGFGKSKLAIQFAHQTYTETGRSVFWVYGADKAAFEESYRALADVLALPRRHEPGVSVLALVRDWLQRDDVHPWFMIVDNADDGKVFFSEDDSFASYLPKSTNGKVLLTSRSLDAAQRLVGNTKDIYRIPNMAEDQALELMQCLLEDKLNEDEAGELVRALDCIPLAVKQAAAYINHRSPRFTAKSYLEDFYKSEKRKDNLLRSDKGDLDRQTGVSNSVVVTWQVTFKQIRDDHPSAANLLSLMSQFQAQNIPEFMLHWYDNDHLTDYGRVDDRERETKRSSVSKVESSSGSDDNSDNESERMAFEEDLDILRSYSLVEISTEDHFSMHPLVQFCTRRWISELGGSARWNHLFIKLAARHFPSGEFENWPVCQALLPHIQPILNIKPKKQSAIEDWAALLDLVSYYSKMIGQNSRAQTFAEASVEATTNLLGQDHPKVLEYKSNLAAILWRRGKLKEAYELGAELVKAKKAILGDNHWSTLAEMSNLAVFMSHQGRLHEAERLDMEVLEGRQATLGHDHPNTLQTMNNLGITLCALGRLEEAEKLQVEVLAKRQARFGHDHRDTVTSLNNLALTFRDLGRLQEAEGLQAEVLARRKATLGLEHFDTLISMCNLASTMSSQGRLKEAEELGAEALEKRKIALGFDHPDTLVSMHNLACNLYYQGRFKEALFLMQDCACLREQTLTYSHPDTQSSLVALQAWRAEIPLPEEEEETWKVEDV